LSRIRRGQIQDSGSSTAQRGERAGERVVLKIAREPRGEHALWYPEIDKPLSRFLC